MPRTIFTHTEEQGTTWAERADAEGVNLSEWIRRACNARAVRTYVEAAAEHELEPTGRAVAAKLPEDLGLPDGLVVGLESRPLVRREIRPDPKPSRGK